MAKETIKVMTELIMLTKSPERAAMISQVISDSSQIEISSDRIEIYNTFDTNQRALRDSILTHNPVRVKEMLIKNAALCFAMLKSIES
jgi:formyltetrahydrofolate synthetase